MDREQIANSPTVGMEFMYNRTDGLWLFKVTDVDSDDGHVSYDYKYYKGDRRRSEVSLDELVLWCLSKPWERGSTNSRDRWKVFMVLGSEGGTNMINKVELVGNLREPTWEV